MMNLKIANIMFLLNVSNPSETTMNKHKESHNILKSERPCFRSVAQKYITYIVTVPQMLEVNISCFGLHVYLSHHSHYYQYCTATQIHVLLDYF